MPVSILWALMPQSHYVLEPQNTIFVRVILEFVIYSITRR